MIDSRTCEGGKAVRRRRECDNCTQRFTTYERSSSTKRLMVVKKDGRRVPWDKEKILTRAGAGVLQAAGAGKRTSADRRRSGRGGFASARPRSRPRRSSAELVTDRLRRVDQVAYVRFASVYRQFKTLEELVDEARAVIDARRV